MLILDRYLLRQFIWTFAICYLSLAGLYIIFDAFTNLEEFMRCAEKQGNLLGIMVSHYAFQLIFFFDLAAGLVTLISAMFTVSWIQRHNEMVALQSAGISRIRVVAPLVAAAVAIAIFSAANRELVIPRFRKQLSRKPQDMIGDVAQELAPRYDNRTDILIRGRATFGDRQRISKPNFLLPRSLDHYGKQLVAENAFYRPPRGNRPGGYLLESVETPKDLHARPSLTQHDRPVIITPHDAPDWLEPDQCFVVSDISFEQLASRRGWRRFASTRELIAGLHNDSLGFGADVRVAIHSRIVQPLLDVTLLFLGLPLVLTRESRNVFIAMGLCAVVVSIFMLVVIAFQYLGSIYSVRPVLAAWAPLMLFVPVAAGMAESMWR